MAFVLAHLSDPHLGPLSRPVLRDLTSKRALGYLNWRHGRKDVHRGDILAAILNDLNQAAPDHIVITGDLTNLALENELLSASAWLDQLASPERLTIIPGNHDAYVPGALSRATAIWKPYMSADALGLNDPSEVFPFVRRRGPVALIGLSTAIATRPFMASGRVDGRQLVRLADDLVNLSREGLFRIVLIHHPLEVTRKHWNKRLINAGTVRTLITTAGAELILHGHMHMPSHTTIAGPKALINVFGVPSASADPSHGKHPAGYALHRIEDLGAEGFRWDYERRGILPNGTVSTLGSESFTLPKAQA